MREGPNQGPGDGNCNCRTSTPALLAHPSRSTLSGTWTHASDAGRDRAFSELGSLPHPQDPRGIAQQIRQAQDILDDGTQGPTKSCNGISVGLGFEAVSVKAGAVLDDPPPPDPCL